MNRNLQAEIVTGHPREVFLVDLPGPEQDFRLDLARSLADASVCHLIAYLECKGNVTLFDEDTRWTIVDDLKDFLGSKAANLAGDSDDDQEAAFVTAETWVEDNISHASRPEIVAAAVVLYGYEKAGRMIR